MKYLIVIHTKHSTYSLHSNYIENITHTHKYIPYKYRNILNFAHNYISNQVYPKDKSCTNYEIELTKNIKIMIIMKYINIIIKNMYTYILLINTAVSIFKTNG